MRRGFLVAAAAFGLALAVIVGLRLEQASLAVLVGVACGILAGLPVSAALLYIFWRERQARREEDERHWRHLPQRTAVAPPVIVLNAGRGADLLSPPPLLSQPAERQFTIVGEEEML